MTENHTWGLFCVFVCICIGAIAYLAGKEDGIKKGQILAGELTMEIHRKMGVVRVEMGEQTYFFSDCWISGSSNQGILTFHER